MGKKTKGRWCRYKRWPMCRLKNIVALTASFRNNHRDPAGWGRVEKKKSGICGRGCDRRSRGAMATGRGHSTPANREGKQQKKLKWLQITSGYRSDSFFMHWTIVTIGEIRCRGDNTRVSLGEVGGWLAPLNFNSNLGHLDSAFFRATITGGKRVSPRFARDWHDSMQGERVGTKKTLPHLVAGNHPPVNGFLIFFFEPLVAL